MAASAFFASSSEPSWLPRAREDLVSFVTRHNGQRNVVCITSGGTTVPLERNTVRFIDNFSTGNRGAALAEQMLHAGYAVIFLHRQNSVPFTSVHEYLFLLRDAVLAMRPAGARAMLILAAAVSDFYVPDQELAEHKIQSSTGAAEGAKSGLTLHLRDVPKLLGCIKLGTDGEHRVEPWAPAAFVVSFKLETNASILIAKAAAAIRKYGVDLVCANQLQSYKKEVTLVRQSGDLLLASVSIHGNESEEVSVDGVHCHRVVLADDKSSEVELEELLVKELVNIHAERSKAAETSPHAEASMDAAAKRSRVG